jgi:cysteine synthase
VMPESMSVERRKIMSAYGAEFVLTAREKGMKGAIEKAYELAKENPKAWIPQQFDNEANTEIHRKTTAQEIIDDFPGGLDYVITGVGTGGHITAIAEVVKPKMPSLKVLAVEPELSPVLSGGTPAPHPLQGLGAGFVPSILNTGALDGVVTVGKDEAYDYARRLAKEEAIFVGVSTGAALAAVAKKLPEIPKGSKILTFNYDTGERYLSIEGLFE